MADYYSLAINEIRLYLWDQLKNAGILKESNYYADGFDTAIIPIIPEQQVPEFNNLLSGQTYIVYQCETLPTDTQWWISHELINFMVYSPRYDEAAAIVNFMTDLFRRYDDSAKDIKTFNIASTNYLYYYSAIQSIKSPIPSEYEGGIKTGYIDVLFCYSRITDPNGRF